MTKVIAIQIEGPTAADVQAKIEEIQAGHRAALLRCQELLDVIYGADPDDPISSIMHLAEEAGEALGRLRVLEYDPDTAEDFHEARIAANHEAVMFPEDEDLDPDACDLCAGKGFGADDEGAVACPQCNGTGKAED